MIYAADGFAADDDLYEAGVEVDDSAFGKSIDGNGEGDWFENHWEIIGAGVGVLVIFLVIILYCACKRKDDDEDEDEYHDSKSKSMIKSTTQMV